MKPGRRLDQEFENVYEQMRILANRVTALENPTPEQLMYLGAACGRQPWVDRIEAFEEFLARTPGIPLKQTMHRSYTPDTIKASLAAGFNVFGSIVPPMTATEQQLEGIVETLLPSDGQKLILTSWHEPENKQEPAEWRAQQYKLQSIIYRLQDEGYDIEHAVVLMSWTFEQGEAQPWLIPTDIYGLDGYDKWAQREAAEIFGGPLDTIRLAHGNDQRWGVAEFGVVLPEHKSTEYTYQGQIQWQNGPAPGEPRTEDDARRWVRDALKYFESEGAEFALAFDSYVDGPWSWLYLAEEMT